MKPKSTLLRFLALAGSSLLAISSSHAATHYWDTNSNTAGSSGGTTASGTWSSGGSTWSTSPTGVAATSAYTTLSTDDLFFSAGTNATGASAITLTTAQDAKSLTFEEGTVTISGASGVITLGGAGGNITVNSGASAIIGNNTDTVIGGSVGLTKLGNGTLTLNGTLTNTFTGGINVNGGTLALDYANIAASTDLVTSQALNFGGGNLTLKGKTGANATTQSFGNVTVNSGGGSLLIDPNNGTSTTLTLGSLTATAAGGSLTLGKAVTANTGTVAITTTSDMDATGIYGGRIVFANGTANTGYDWATNTGGGGPNYTLSAYGGYSALDLTAGTDTLNSRITASQTLGGARVSNSLKIENPAAGQTLALGSNLLTLSSGGLLVTGTNAVSITGTAGATRLTAGNGSGAYDLVVHQYNSGGLTIGAVIGNNGGNATTLTKAGTGNLTLSGLNTFSGGLVVNGGKVIAGVAQTGFTGGITVSNGGVLEWSVSIGTNTFGNNTNALIFKGSGGSTSVVGSGGTNHTYTSGQVDAGAVASLGAAGGGSSATTYTFTNGVSGDGELRMAGGGSNQAAQVKTINLNNSSGFTGIWRSSQTSNTAPTNFNFSALGDGGKISQSAGSDRIGLTVNYTGAAATGMTFNTRQLEINGGAATYDSGITINSNGSGALIFNSDLSVTANATSGKFLTLGGTSTGFNNQFNGLISNGTSPNAIGLAKTGASTWVVSNTSNSYSGGTSIRNGTLHFTNTGAMPATGLVAVGTGTTLAVNAGAASGEWTNATSGNGSIGGLLAGLGGQVGSTVSWTGAVGLGIDTTNATAGTMTYSGVIANLGTSLGITKLGTGTLVLDQANTFSGATTVSAGTLALANNLALQNSALTFSAASQLDLTGRTTLQIGGLNSSVNLSSVTGYDASVTSLTLNTGTGVSSTYSGNISNGAATNLTLTKSGAGTQTLTGTSDYSGGTIISGGRLHINSNANLGHVDGDIRFTSTGIILLNSGSSLTYSAGRTVTVDSGATAIFGDVGINGTIVTTVNGRITGEGGVQFGHYQLGTGSADLTSTANDFQGALRIGTSDTLSQTYSGYAVSTASLADASGYGNIIFGRGNGSSGNTGTFAWSNNAISALVLDHRRIELDTTAEKSILANNNTNTARTVTVNTDLLVSRAGNKVFGLGGSNTGNNAFNGLIANSISPAAVISLEKSGAGTWNVTDASNSYTGGTIVNGGALGFASGALGSTGTINAAAGTLLWLPGNTQDISSRLPLASGISTFHTNGNDVTFANAVGSGVGGSLSKTGLGALTLGGSNTYTGSTTLNAGKLKLDYSTNDTSKLSNTASIGTLLLNGGTLELSGSAGNHVETVLSTTLNTGTTFITQPTGGATLSMGGITFTGGAIDFSEDNIATTTTGVTNGILSQRATVAGTNFAMKSGSNIVAYNYATNGVTGYTGTAMSANINYALQTAGGANTLSGTTGATTNTLKIANTATGSLAVAANTLTVGTILFTGSADYDITTSGAGKITPSILHNYGTGGAVLNLGALGGALTQFGTGKAVLNNAATAAGGLTVNGGTVQISANAQIGLVASGTGITLNNGTLLASETLALNNAGANHRTVTLGAGGGTLAAASTKTLTVSGVISGALNPLIVGSSGNTGTVSLSAVNTYTGATSVDAGTLNVSAGNINSTSAISVAAGGTLRYNSSTALTVAPTLAGNGTSNRAVLGGTGTIGVTVTLNDPGDVLSPGNSPGILTYSVAQTWDSFSYDWEVNNWTGTTAGTDFDQLDLDSTLTLSGGPGSYILNVLGLTAGNTAGLVPNFDDSETSWTILTSTGITGFDADNWTINTAGFTDPYIGIWSISQDGNSLMLNYAIPEPNVPAMIGSFGIIALLRRRRA